MFALPAFAAYYREAGNVMLEEDTSTAGLRNRDVVDCLMADEPVRVADAADAVTRVSKCR